MSSSSIKKAKIHNPKESYAKKRTDIECTHAHNTFLFQKCACGFPCRQSFFYTVDKSTLDSSPYLVIYLGSKILLGFANYYNQNVSGFKSSDITLHDTSLSDYVSYLHQTWVPV